MKTSLYNQDGSLSSEAQFLLSPKPDDVSIAERRKTLKKFRSQLSPEDLKEFERLKRCVSNAKYRAKNPEKVKQDNAKWRAENPEKVKQDSAKWKAENPEKVKENYAKWKAENPDYDANWYVENIEKAKENHANWRAANPGYSANYIKRRRSEDPLFRLQHNVRSACTKVVKHLSLGKKPVSTFKWIGCSPEELKAHLESLFTEGMTWENYGEWHVDHIRPVCSFTAEEWEQVNHYTSLRPLWAEDNFAKSGFDKQQSVRSKNKMETVEVSEPKKSQTPVANKD